MGPIAGGVLEGEVAAWPSDWSFTSEIDNVLLETNPDDPYSVTVWGVAHEGSFFVAAAQKDNQWAQYIAQNENVRLSIEGVLYDARAIAITDVDEIKAVSPSYIQKYEIEYEGNFIEEGTLYRLEPR
jgi:hypothetical protein